MGFQAQPPPEYRMYPSQCVRREARMDKSDFYLESLRGGLLAVINRESNRWVVIVEIIRDRCAVHELPCEEDQT